MTSRVWPRRGAKRPVQPASVTPHKPRQPQGAEQLRWQFAIELYRPEAQPQTGTAASTNNTTALQKFRLVTPKDYTKGPRAGSNDFSIIETLKFGKPIMEE